MGRKITIYDIADELKISPSTVSRALAGNTLVNIQTRKKIIATAEKLGYINYKVNSNANIIAVIVPEINNYFYTEVISSIQSVIKDNFLISIFCTFNSSSIEKEIVAKLDPAYVKCVIISQSTDSVDSTHLTDINQKGVPVILFNRVDYSLKRPKFLIDNYMDSYMITNHLVSSGYRRIAFAAKHYNCPIYKERIQAYKDVLIDNNIDFNPDYLIYSELTVEDTYDVINRFINLNLRPDALILPSFTSTLQALSIAKLNNISIPQDMAVVSFDEDPECKYSNPSITGVERPCIEIGTKIGELALKICTGQKYNVDTTMIFSSNLIIRGSSLSNH